MKFLDLAKSRYTTKKYTPNNAITEEKIQELKETLRLSPSSINSQPWKFIFVSDEKMKQELAAVSKFNAHKVTDASHVVVFCAIDDVKKFEDQIHKNLPDGPIGYYNNFIKPLPEFEIKSWMQHQVYLALGFFLGACATMEIDSTSMEGIENEKYDKILKLDGYKTMFAVAIGYRRPEDENQPSKTPKSRLKLEEVIQSI